jgi:hypothetical protein
MPFGKEIWGDSSIVIPKEIAGNRFRNIFTDEIVMPVDQQGRIGLTLSEIFVNFPLALLEKEAV